MPMSLAIPKTVRHDEAEDSPVMNETLSVINEHMTDMHLPRPLENTRPRTNDSGSEYSAFIDHRLSYIAGHETDEEEHGKLTEQEVLSWSPDQVAEHLEDIGVDVRHCIVFREQEITGEVLLSIDQASIFMKEFDLGLVGQRLRTWHRIKAFQDEVSGSPTPIPKQKSVFGADAAADRHMTRSVTNPVVESPRPSATTRTVSSPQNTQKSRLSILPHSPPTDLDRSSEQQMLPKSGLHSPNRPSAASIRDFNHSRRHSAADTAPVDLPAAKPSPSPQHKKTPSLDRNWTMGSPGTASSPTTRNLLRKRDDTHSRHPSADTSHSRHPSRDHSRMPSASRDPSTSRDHSHTNKRSTFHSREASHDALGIPRASTFGPDGKTNRATVNGLAFPSEGIAEEKRRHSRFGSVDSIKDPIRSRPNSIAANPRGHGRNASANEALPPTSTSSRLKDKLGQLTRPETESTMSTLLAKAKPRIGLRAISDAVTGNERQVMTSPSSPVKDTRQPSLTESTSPSAASGQRESTDASSRSIQTGTTAAKRKTKKETSAYMRGLERKSPQEQIQGCDYSGWMKKKSSNIMTTWKPRLFVLRGRRLSYYYADTDEEEKGLIDISCHRVLPADSDILTGIHATVTGAKSSPVSPSTEANDGSKTDNMFIFKLVPPRTGLSKAVNFTKPTIHYFAVENIREGRLWMAALMKATIDRDESKPATTSYQLKTISLAKARQMKQRPPALMNEENEEGLQIQGLSLEPEPADALS